MSDIFDTFLKVLPIGTFFSGVFIERYKKKEIVIEKVVKVQSVGLTILNHPFYGNIQLLYNSIPADNMYLATVELQNVSNTGLKDFEIIFSVPIGFIILQDSLTLIQDDVTLGLGWSNDFKEKFNNVLSTNLDDKPATYDADLSSIQRHRFFNVNVLNKKKQLIANLLVTGPANLDTVQVGIYEENVKTIQRLDRDIAQKKYATIINIGCTLLFLFSAWPVFIFSTSIRNAIILMVLSPFVCYYSAVGIHYIFTFLKDYFKK